MKRRALKKRYGRAATAPFGVGLQVGDPVAFRRSGGQIAYGHIAMFAGDRVKVSFCELPLEKWLPVTQVSKSAFDLTR